MSEVFALKLFFITIRWLDVLEVLLVTFLLYQLYNLMRGTIAIRIFAGLMALYVIYAIVDYADMTVLEAVLGSVTDVFVLAVIILFQPEIRRLLLLIGQNPLVSRFVATSERDEVVEEVMAAIAEMSNHRIGALIAVARTSGLRSYIETGTALQAQVNRDLLVSIFYPNSPLHDGATIIQSGRVQAARCILPVSQGMKLDASLGLRHRAALGLAEQTDAFVVVTSEETGRISYAENGVLRHNVTLADLRRAFERALSNRPQPARISQ